MTRDQLLAIERLFSWFACVAHMGWLDSAEARELRWFALTHAKLTVECPTWPMVVA